MNIINCVDQVFELHFSALGQFYAKSNHSMERSDIFYFMKIISALCRFYLLGLNSRVKKGTVYDRMDLYNINRIATR